MSIPGPNFLIFFPKNSKLSVVFFTFSRSSFEPTDGRMIGGWGAMQEKTIGILF